jgi:NarL family two-component system response regulator LiaR
MSSNVESGAVLARFPKGQLVSVALAVYPPLWGELLAEMFGQEEWIKVVGRASNEDGLRALIAEHAPQVVLFDYEGLGPNAEGTVARQRRLAPKTRILVLARRSGEEMAVGLLRAGAAGLVGKGANFSVLLNAVGAVAVGEVWANRKVTARAIEQLAAPRPPDPEGRTSLTRREWEVIEAVGRGLRNRAIGRALGISEKTVKTHLNHIFAKLHVESRFTLALWAQGELQREG